MKYQENFITGEVRKIIEVGDVFFFKTKGVYGKVINKMSGICSGYLIESGKDVFRIGRTALLRDAEFVGVDGKVEVHD